MNTRIPTGALGTECESQQQATLEPVDRANSKAPEDGRAHSEQALPVRLTLGAPTHGASPYPIQALPDPLRTAIQDIERIVQVPLALASNSVLASLNLATQAHVNVETIDGRVLATSLFFLTEALSGERKTTVQSVVLAPHEAREASLGKTASEERRERDMAVRVWDAKERAFEKKMLRSKMAGSDPSWDGYDKAFREQVGARPQPWLGSPLLLARDLTVEGLVKQLMVWPSMGLFSDEAAVFFGGFTMNKENLLKTAGIFSSLWDGKGVNRLRVSDGVTNSPNVRLSSHLLCQPVVFSQFVATSSELKGQGFLPRCLITRVQSKIGFRRLIAEDIRKAQGVTEFHALVSRLLEGQPIKRDGGNLEVDPRNLTLSPAAQKLYEEMYNEIESQQRPGEPLRELTGTASKAAEQALRVAATLEMAVAQDSRQISGDSFEAAREIVLFHLNEALRMEEEGRFDPDIAKAEILLNWMYERKKITGEDDELISTREIAQYGPNQFRRMPKEVPKLLKLLCDQGYLVALSSGSKHKQTLYMLGKQSPHAHSVV